MHTRSTILSSRLLAACALGACLISPLAIAAGPGPAMSAADIEARYKTDVARCNAGQTNQDKATCLREAGAAREEANRNRLNNGNPQAYDANQKARCDALPVEQRDECMLQMSGVGTTTQGSIGGGGGAARNHHHHDGDPGAGAWNRPWTYAQPACRRTRALTDARRSRLSPGYRSQITLAITPSAYPFRPPY